MSSYEQFCPIARGAEIFATRWTPLIVRNLLLGCRTFTEIRSGLPGISRTLLAERLRLLERYGVVERVPRSGGRGFAYELTQAGRELQPVCQALGLWGSRWLELAPEHCDSGIVLWALSRKLPPERMPPRRLVVRFAVPDGERDRYWLLVERPRAEVCAKPPGFETDVALTATSEWLAKWFTGRIGLGEAMRRRLIEVRGPRELVRVVAGWGGLGTLAQPRPETVRAEAANPGWAGKRRRARAVATRRSAA